MKYLINIRLKKDEVFFGSGPASLLEKIHKTNSISEAAKQMDMSYSKAWKILKRMESQLGFKMTNRNVGGKGGGNTTLTEQGINFLEKYNLFFSDVKTYADLQFEKYFKIKEDET